MAQMAYTRKWLVDTLRRIGLTQAADDALREMPEQFDLKQLRNSASGTTFPATFWPMRSA